MVPSVVLGLCEIVFDFLDHWHAFVVEAEIDAEANEGGKVEDEDHEAHQERGTAAFTGELEILGVESHLADCVLS